MKKLLLATTFLLAASSPCFAKAQLNNKQIIGKWCYDHSLKPDVDVSFYRPDEEGQKCDFGDKLLIITKNHIEGWEWGCTYASVKTWHDPVEAVGVKTPGLLVSKIVADCSAFENCKWKEEMTIHLDKGSLRVSRKELKKEVCD